jgi:predicted Zn-dependent protease
MYGDRIMKQSRIIIIAVGALVIATFCLGQSNDEGNSLADRALQEYKSGHYAAAERLCREIVKQNPSNVVAQIYLGQSLFMQRKYSDAIVPFQRARDLEANGAKLTPDQHRILIDQLVMSYGISGDLKKVHALLDEAIRKDPDYPLNYYNLACAYSGEGNKDKMLENLSLAFQHKDHILKGERMPDPRTDDSFQDYVHDEDFIKLMKQIGYN